MGYHIYSYKYHVLSSGNLEMGTNEGQLFILCILSLKETNDCNYRCAKQLDIRHGYSKQLRASSTTIGNGVCCAPHPTPKTTFCLLL
jgi:hypothetical protein